MDLIQSAWRCCRSGRDVEGAVAGFAATDAGGDRGGMSGQQAALRFGVSVINGPVNREVFELYVEKVLVPELEPDDIVVMDNFSSHKGPAVRAMIRAATSGRGVGHGLGYLESAVRPLSTVSGRELVSE